MNANQLHALVNALFNASSCIFLILAFVAIKGGDAKRHKKLMLSAFACSTAFLVSYLLRHYLHGSTPFPGQGGARIAYLTILFSHMALAAFVPVGAILAIRFGLKGRFDAHKKLVKWAFPAWLYVSVTGIVIYGMLFHWPS